MIRDRGRIKWTSMMLPEHVKMLREQQAAQQKQKKPEIDVQMWEEFDERLQQALQTRKPVAVTYFHNGDFTTITGTVKKVDVMGKQLVIVEQSSVVHVAMESVTALEFSEA